MRDGHNGYLPSVGIPAAREAVALDYKQRGLTVSPDRVLITTGSSEGIELALNALADEGDEVLVPLPTYPLYTAVLAKIAAQPWYYRTDPNRDWLPDLDHMRSLVTPRTRVLVVIDPNNPTGAVYPPATRRQLVAFAEEHGLTILADEVYGDLGFDGSVPLLGTLDPEAPIISSSSLSKAYLAPGWRAGWMVVGATPRLDGVLAAIKKLADGRLCSPGPMQYAVAAALNGDRSHQVTFRRALAERARVTTDMLNAIPGMRCVAPRAAFYVLPSVALPPGRTDEDFVLALLRETGILCVHGSGFGMPPEEGFFRHCLPRRAARAPIHLLRDRRLHARVSRPWLSPRGAASRGREERRSTRVDPLRAGGPGAHVLPLVGGLPGARRAAPHLHLDAHRDRPLAHRQRHSPAPRAACAPRAAVGGHPHHLRRPHRRAWSAWPGSCSRRSWNRRRRCGRRSRSMLQRGQQWLMERGLLNRELTIREAVEQAPVNTDAVGTLLGAIGTVLGGVFGVLTVLIVTFYLLIDAENILQTFLRLFPLTDRPRAHEACRRVSTKVSAWLGGQLLLAGIIGSTAALGLWLMGVPYFYVLALVAAVGEMIPVVGPLLAAIPAILVALTVSPALALGVTIFYVVQQQFENHVLVPKVMERQVGVSATIVIVVAARRRLAARDCRRRSRGADRGHPAGDLRGAGARGGLMPLAGGLIRCRTIVMPGACSVDTVPPDDAARFICACRLHRRRARS